MRGKSLSREIRPACAVLATLLLAGPALAQVTNGNLLPNPRLTAVTPPGGKAGATVEVTVTGTDLEEPEALLFSHPNIKAVAVVPPEPPPMKPDPKKSAPPAQKKPAGKTSTTKFMVTIGANVPLGYHDVRLVNKWGVSNPRVFVVGSLNELAEKEPNNDIEQAQRIEVGTTINGAISAPTDVDYFVFAAKKGQRVVVSLLGPSIDSRINPELKLYDSTGKQIAYHRPPPGQDALVEWAVPADGDYYVRVCQFTYTQGGPEFFYRLNVATGPWIDAVFPPVVFPGKSAELTFYGRNLPGGKPLAEGTMSARPLEVAGAVVNVQNDMAALQRLAYTGHVPPVSSGVDGFEYRLRTPTRESNPVLLTYASAPVILDKGANATVDTAQEIPVPCEVAGRIARPRDRHWYTFVGKKGDVYVIDVLSHRLGAPTDMFLTVRNATNPKQIAEVTQQDDDPGTLSPGQLYTPSRDPAPFRFTVPADGKYQVLVGSHVSDTQFGPEHVYVLRIRPERPDFRLVVMPPDSHRPDACVLGQGGNALFTVFAWRQDGFKGDIKLGIDGLPAGVTCKPQVLGPTAKHASLVVSAATNAAAFTGEIKVKGTATINGQTVVREARPASITWPVQPQQNIPTISRMDRSLMLAVRSQAPLHLAAGVDKVTVSHGDKLTIPLKLTRLWPDLKAQFQVQPVPQELPQGMNFGALSFAPGKDEQSIVMTVPNNVPPGHYNFVFQGFAPIPFNKDPMAKQKPNVNVVQPSTPVLVTILPKQVAQVSVSNGNPTIKLGNQAEVVVRVNRQYDYADAFKVKLVLPQGMKGLSADEVTIPADQNEVKLLLRVPADATPGNRPNLTVQAVALVEGTVPLTHETKINVNIVK
jgi:hypothetical protein